MESYGGATYYRDGLEEGGEMKRPLSEEDCLAIGGHCWNFHSANMIVNEFGEFSGQMHLVHYPSGNEPQFRTCKHCGKRQLHKEEWNDV